MVTYEKLGVARLHGSYDICQNPGAVLICPVMEDVGQEVHVRIFDRLCCKEVIWYAFYAVIECFNVVDFENYGVSNCLQREYLKIHTNGRQVLKNESSGSVREASSELGDLVTTSSSNINEHRVSLSLIKMIYNSFLHRIRIIPGLSCFGGGKLPGHESVKVPRECWLRLPERIRFKRRIEGKL